VTEWFTHPGYPDPESGSNYDLARREDLDEILRARVRARFDQPIWGDAVLAIHSEAWRYPGGPLEAAREERPVAQTGELQGEPDGPAA
jgi:hypothetical protein